MTVTASVSATKTVTPPASPTPRPSGPCATPQLTLSLGQARAPRDFYTPLIVTNTGATCTLFGYPGVSFVDAAGATVGKPAAREGGRVATVVIKHGATASALLHQPNPACLPGIGLPQGQDCGNPGLPAGPDRIAAGLVAEPGLHHQTGRLEHHPDAARIERRQL